MSLKQTQLHCPKSHHSDSESTQVPSPSEWASSRPLPGPIENASVGKGARAQNYQWSDQQNRKYYNFLLKLRERSGSDVPLARIRKINIQMSRAVKSRTHIQCRSHNQKMIKRLGSLEAVIDYFDAYFTRKADSAPVLPCQVGSHYQSSHNESLLASEQKQQKMNFLWPITKWDLQYVLQPERGVLLAP